MGRGDARLKKENEDRGLERERERERQHMRGEMRP